MCIVGCPIFISYLLKKSTTDVDTMCGNTWIIVTQKSCVPHYQIILQLTTGNMASVKHMAHQRAVGKLCMIMVQ